MTRVWRSDDQKKAALSTPTTKNTVSILEHLLEDDKLDIHSMSYQAVPYMLEAVPSGKDVKFPLLNVFCEASVGLQLDKTVQPVTVTPGHARSLLLLLEVCFQFLPTLADFVCF